MTKGIRTRVQVQAVPQNYAKLLQDFAVGLYDARDRDFAMKEKQVPKISEFNRAVASADAEDFNRIAEGGGVEEADVFNFLACHHANVSKHATTNRIKVDAMKVAADYMDLSVQFDEEIPGIEMISIPVRPVDPPKPPTFNEFNKSIMDQLYRVFGVPRDEAGATRGCDCGYCRGVRAVERLKRNDPLKQPADGAPKP
jgi:hypothetical protein